MKLPPIFYFEGNPNNKPATVIGIHHQWLYGRRAILQLAHTLRFFLNAGKYSPFRQRSSDKTAEALLQTCYGFNAEEGYWDTTHILEDGETKNPLFGDNNCGITIIDVSSGRFEYCLISLHGIEAKVEPPAFEPLSARQYVLAYYPGLFTKAADPEGRKIQIKMRETLRFIGVNTTVLNYAEVSGIFPTFPEEGSIPAKQAINPWEEQPPHQDSLPADKPAGEPPFAWVEQPLPGEKDLPGVKPVDEIMFAWEEPSPQEESGNSGEKPSGEALFPWEEQSPEKENPLPAEKSARGLLFPWEEQLSQEEKNLPAEKPAREPLFPWNEPAPPPDKPATEEQSSWTEEYPAEEQPQGASWLPQGDQTSAAQPPVEFQDSAPRSAAPRIKRFSRKQWIFLAARLFIWLVLVVIFIIKVISDLVL